MQEQQGYWWSWGAGTHGQLASRSFQDELLPRPTPCPSPSPLRQLACGGSHAVAAFSTGEVFTWGNGDSGQLGHDDNQNLCEPALVKQLSSIKICHVSAGWSHTAFLSDDQALFTCGSGGFGQLGHGSFDSCSVPRRVDGLSSMRVLLAACGMRHTLVLVGSGEATTVYAFGSTKRGQLGISLPADGTCKFKGRSESHRFCLPQKINRFNECVILSIYANGDHSAALSDSGNLYIWGRGFYTADDVSLPVKVSNELRFRQVALGWNHLLALTYDGQVFAAGSQRYGASRASQVTTAKKHSKTSECANRETSSIFRLDPCEPLKGCIVRWVATGAEHSVVVLDDGSVMTWGWGEHGQLGLGTSEDHENRTGVNMPRMPNSEVYCGCGFTFFVPKHAEKLLVD